MELLNKKEIERLVKHCGEKSCISIYMPTEKGREKAKGNSTRFKTLLNQAEKRLGSRGVSSSEQKELLEPARKLVNENIFWANQSESLAYFISKDFTGYYRLPMKVDEIAVVRNSFHLKPLFRFLTSDGQYYILALSQKNIRFLHATRSEVEEIDTSSLNEKLEGEFGDELFEPTLQFHTGAPETSGIRAAIFHGHGGDIDGIMKERLLNYFRLIDREIQNLVTNKDAPLLLASV